MKVLFCLIAAVTVVAANPMSPFNVVCTRENRGQMFPNPNNRYRYLVCEFDGRSPTDMPCAPGTWFEVGRGCVHATNGNGGGNGGGGGGDGDNGCDCEEPVVTPAPTTTTSTTTPCPCPNEPTTTCSCPDGNAPEGINCSATMFCVTGTNRLFTNPNDRNSYFSCPWPGRCALRMPCAANTVFNEAAQLCDWP